MGKDKVLICERCGGKRSRRKCDYCGTEYYNGPEIPEEQFNHHVGTGIGVYYDSASSCYVEYPVSSIEYINTAIAMSPILNGNVI